MIINYKDEIWKDVVTDKDEYNIYFGLYEVSNYGRIKRLLKTVNGIEYEEKLLSQRIDKNGYLITNLKNKNGKAKTMKVHRLVTLAFIPNPNNLPQVNHKDENVANNNLWNLEWCDSKYNNNYGTKNQRISEKLKGKINNPKNLFKAGKDNPMFGKHGAENPNSKCVLCITTEEVFTSVKEAEDYYKCGGISAVCKGIRRVNGVDELGRRLEWKYISKYEYLRMSKQIKIKGE